MTKGFLLIDQCKNTIIIPYNDNFLRCKIDGQCALANVREHKTLKELEDDVRKYLKGVYEG